jgi:hypothetical protein
MTRVRAARVRRAFAGAWLVVLGCAAAPGWDRVAVAGDPAQRWRTIETAHFFIHYYVLPGGKGEEVVAQRLAVVAEDAHRRLVPFLGEGLRRRTHVVVTDGTDDYNGSAGVYPYPSIEIFATSPDDRAELNDYDDWLSELFIHEYSHILHIGTVGGACATLVNWLAGWGIGVVYAPNQAQPRFLKEGLAVHEESARTSGGRLRNSIWQMYLRAAALEGKLQRIDQVANNPIQFPMGNSAYLYGSAVTQFVAERYGEQALLDISLDYGTSCLPGAINRSAQHITGKTWVQLYDEFRVELTRRSRALAAALALEGLTPTRALTGVRPFVARPVFLPDGRSVIFADSDGYSRQQLRRLDVVTGEGRRELGLDSAGGPSVSADGRLVAYHAATPYKTDYFYNDVFLFDRATRSQRRLTVGLRATNPGLSPDGKRVAFEVNDSGSRGIGLLALDVRRPPCGDAGEEDESCHVEMLVPATGFDHAYTPVFSPDGKTLAFSWWKKGEGRDIWTLDLATRTLTPITRDRALDLEPRFSDDGKWLYFVSDRTGIYNLYAYERGTGKVFQATNVVNGVFDPTVSPDGRTLAFVGFRAEGYVLEVADLDPARWKEATPSAEPPRPASESPPDGPRLPSRPYRPWRTVFPFVFQPFADPDGYGEVIGLQVSGSDVSGRHAWGLSLGFGTGRADDVRFDANYSYLGLWPSLNWGLSRVLLHKGGLVLNGIDRGYDEDDWSFGTSVSLPLYRDVVASSDLSFSYNLTYARNVSGVPIPSPSDLVPQIPETGRIAGFGLSWSYQNVRRYAYSVSSEEGRELSLSLGLGAPQVGSQYTVYSANWRYFEYVRVPWPSRYLRNHVLALGYSGGISGGDLKRRGLFYLGGYPSQDLLKSIYDFSRPGSASLRGYPYASVVGDQFHVWNFEYRFPILWLERGYQTFPVYFRRLHGKAFVDYGGAFFGDAAKDKFRLGVGGELICELTYLWFFDAALQLGYAHGFDQGGGNQVYFLLNSPF